LVLVRKYYYDDQRRRIRWSEPVAVIGDKKVLTRIWLGDPKEKDHLEDLGINRRIFTLKKYVRISDTELISVSIFRSVELLLIRAMNFRVL
jgi:hypothetical protein